MRAIQRLRELGQSVWLDFIDRAMLTSGELERLIANEGLAGLTSNPTIFQKSIASFPDYDGFVQSAPASEPDDALFERIQMSDVALACDLFRPLYDRTNGADGFVSIEVSPKLARDTNGSIEQARRFWRQIGRPNLLVKIPGTREGLPAIEQCLSEGININITLLFSVARYAEVVEAYLRALETRAGRGQPIDRLASVASFFVSRVDTKVDKIIDSLGGPARERATPLRGRIAIDNAVVAYEEYDRFFSAERFERLAACGARRQRVLWASTSTKDPRYPDTYYAEALIGPDTVDTMTLETFRAYVDHGAPEVRLAGERARAHRELEQLAEIGIDLGKITEELEVEGVRSFSEAFDKAIATIASKRAAARGRPSAAAAPP